MNRVQRALVMGALAFLLATFTYLAFDKPLHDQTTNTVTYTVTTTN